MPRIPSYQPDVQGSIGRPQQTINPQEAVMVGGGQSLEQFGKGVQDVGLAIEQQKKVKDATTRALLAEKYKQEALTKAIEFENQAHMQTDAAGTNLVQLFDKQFDKWSQSALKGLPEDDVKLAIGNEVNEIKNRYRGNLFQQSRKMYNEFTVEQTESAMNFRAAAVNRNPYDFDKQYGEYQNLVMQLPYTQENKMKAIQLGRKNMAESAVQGLVQNKQYDLAKNWVTSKFAGVFDAKDQEKILDGIETSKYKAIDLELKEFNRRTNLTAQAKKFEQERTYEEKVKLINEFSGVDAKEDPSKFLAVDELEKQINEDVSVGSLSPTDGQRLIRMVRDEVKEDQDLVTVGLYDKLTQTKGTEGLRAMRAEINQTFDKKQISSATAQRLLGLVKIEEDRIRAEAKKGRKSDPQAKFLANQVQSIKSMAASDIFMNKFEKAKIANVQRQALDELYTLYYYGPKGVKGDAKKAGSLVYKKYFPEVLEKNIPFLPQEYQGFDSIPDEMKFDEGSKRAMEVIKDLVDTGKLTKQEAVQALKQIEAKVNARKAGVKPPQGKAK